MPAPKHTANAHPMAPKRTRIQRQRDLLDIARLYLEGKRQWEIVEWIAGNRPYKLSQQILSIDLRDIQRQWLAEAKILVEEQRRKELAKIDNLEREYWAAYARSKSKSVRITHEGKPCKSKKDATEPDAMTPEITTMVKEDRDGDPRFLEGVQRCIDRRCRLLGLDAPAKQELSGPDGGPIEVEGVGITQGLDMEHLDSLLRDHYNGKLIPDARFADTTGKSTG